MIFDFNHFGGLSLPPNLQDPAKHKQAGDVNKPAAARVYGGVTL
uniref:Uncharacterized protein n=1 Tax=Arundo donax TaxID=35708 RepID=A0A0A9HII6_ARUDO